MTEKIVTPFEVKFAADAPDGTFEGYGATFGNIDFGGDMLVKGAFRETLKAWSKIKSLPKMLLQHGRGLSAVDQLPIGKWLDMSEDDKGLYVKGRLINLDTDGGKRLYGAMREGVLDKMSIGYRAKDIMRGTKPGEPLRTLKSVELVEVSIVTFPMNDQADVLSVKSASDMSIREFERALISGMLPPMLEREAKALLSKGFDALRRERDASDHSEDELKALILRNTNILTVKG